MLEYKEHKKNLVTILTSKLYKEFKKSIRKQQNLGKKYAENLIC